jgi:WD40 repeat protein
MPIWLDDGQAIVFRAERSALDNLIRLLQGMPEPPRFLPGVWLAPIDGTGHVSLLVPGWFGQLEDSVLPGCAAVTLEEDRATDRLRARSLTTSGQVVGEVSCSAPEGARSAVANPQLTHVAYRDAGAFNSKRWMRIVPVAEAANADKAGVLGRADSTSLPVWNRNGTAVAWAYAGEVRVYSLASGRHWYIECPDYHLIALPTSESWSADGQYIAMLAYDWVPALHDFLFDDRWPSDINGVLDEVPAHDEVQHGPAGVAIVDVVNRRVRIVERRTSSCELSPVWSRYGSRLSTISTDGTIRIIDVAAGRETVLVRAAPPISAAQDQNHKLIAWAPDDRALAVCIPGRGIYMVALRDAGDD